MGVYVCFCIAEIIFELIPSEIVFFLYCKFYCNHVFREQIHVCGFFISFKMACRFAAPPLNVVLGQISTKNNVYDGFIKLLKQKSTPRKF